MTTPLRWRAASPSGGVGIPLKFLPYAAAGYWQWASLFGVTAPDDLACIVIASDDCEFNSSAGGDWLFVQVQNARSEAVAADLVHRISTALELGAKTPYVPPVYANPLPHSCATLIRPSVYRTAVGSPTPITALSGPSGWLPVNSAMLVNRGLWCDMGDATFSRRAGGVQSLPGGRWAFALLRSSLTTPGPLTAISVAGMRTGDKAFTRCDAVHSHCLLDALIATHWAEVDLLPAAGGGSDLITRDRRAASRSLLAEIVHQIYTP